jgi:hypothetical protein
MNLRRILGLATILSVVGACSDTPAEPDLLDVSLSHVGQNGMVPLTGVLTQTRQDDTARPGPSYDPFCVNTAAGASAGQVWIPALTIYGEVKATHLGQTTLLQNGCIEISQLAVGGPFLAIGEATLTSANGDEVTYMYDGFVHQGTLIADVDVIITGGTGRFAGASGGFSTSSTGSSLSFPVVYPLDGTISSVGSLK